MIEIDTSGIVLGITDIESGRSYCAPTGCPPGTPMSEWWRYQRPAKLSPVKRILHWLFLNDYRSLRHWAKTGDL